MKYLLLNEFHVRHEVCFVTKGSKYRSATARETKIKKKLILGRVVIVGAGCLERQVEGAGKDNNNNKTIITTA